MVWRKSDLAPGLYLVSTPIGTARDITLRALDVLASADVLAAEDTRTLRRLAGIHGVVLAGRPLVSYHDHSSAGVREKLMAHLRQGRSVAYASEAGTPLVADPGFGLVREAVAAGIAVYAVPGASAVLAALAVAGLPTDRFLFAGFLPSAQAARRRGLAELATVPATLVFYEAPGRVGALLTDLAREYGPDRRAVLCRELTKKFEEVARGTLGDLAERFSGRAPKGEIAVLVDRAAPTEASEDAVEEALKAALAGMSVKDAAEAVALALGRPKREVYQAALRLAAER